ncbi:MAG: dihydrolipoyl dehydrogenase [SAR202 cluster bacterium]|nr:dihydrolipoyl dehydrogenase [SAR202 cluster bacterium]|tara:strand:+ start:24667 stop:26073 length:1407 start_codon:yes stop_codon:yes gene_type:complete
MSENNFDVTVLGGGPGGYVAAIRAAQLGLKTALVEKDDGSGIAGLGGVCLNWGCIPSKSLLKNAELVNQVNDSEKWGISFDNVTFDFPKAIARSRDVSKQLTQGIEYLIKKNKIQLYKDEGLLESGTEISLKSSGDRVSSKNIILATGARPRSLPNLEIDQKTIITSREALELDALPKGIGIVGAGAIGVEFAYLFNAYGVEVTIFEVQDHLVPNEDVSISEELERVFKSRGIGFELGAKVSKTEVDGGGVKVEYEVNGEQKSYSAEKILLAVGVQANTDNLGLENANIELDNGFIKINESMQTSAPNIFAVGDVTGKLMLAHVASTQGVIAAETIGGTESSPINYTDMPRCTYCQPQIASIGLTERQAKEEGHNIKTSQFPFKAVGKAISIGDSEGFVKMIADQDSGELLGAHMIGPEVTEMIAEVGLLKYLEGTDIEIAELTHAHPTLSEAIKEAALSLNNGAIHM